MTDLTDLSDPRLERAVIGYALTCRENYDALARCLRPQDFWLARYGDLWRILCRLPVMDFVTVPEAARVNGLGIHPAELAKCLTTWCFYSGELSDAWLDRKWKGLPTDDLPTDDELAVSLAKQVHALATARRIGQRWQGILKRALGVTV